MEIKEKKELASNWFRDLRDTFCYSFESIEGNKYSFERKSWPHRHSGGGEMSIMKGEVFEKVGVNISTVSGKFQEDFRGQIKGTEQSPEYFATGISLVAHMNSPKIPAFHFNTRFLVTGESWFGGGADLTPTLSDKEAVDLFHNHMKDACSDYKKDAYEEYKKNCDEYFYLGHREEPRGAGGIFFDHINSNDWERDFDFIKQVGKSTHQVITQIVESKKDHSWTEEEKNLQLIKRGRYVEFNLIWDKGTLFGLKTGGSTEAILMSMPPTAKWD